MSKTRVDTAGAAERRIGVFFSLLNSHACGHLSQESLVTMNKVFPMYDDKVYQVSEEGHRTHI